MPKVEVISVFVQCAWHISPLSFFNAAYYTKFRRIVGGRNESAAQTPPLRGERKSPAGWRGMRRWEDDVKRLQGVKLCHF
jgi:hypothetical protein